MKTSNDAIAMLIADHKKVKGIFKRYEKLKAQDDVDEEKGRLAQQVCDALKVHTQVEEEILYPAARDVLDADDLMDEADVEHASAKELIEQIEAMRPGDDHYDAKVTVLGELIEHHVKEEEGEMFPKIKKAKLDTAALGAEMRERKTELMDELGVSEDDDELSSTIRLAPVTPMRGDPRKSAAGKSNSPHSRT